jgi:hypothetical protein
MRHKSVVKNIIKQFSLPFYINVMRSDIKTLFFQGAYKITAQPCLKDCSCFMQIACGDLIFIGFLGAIVGRRTTGQHHPKQGQPQSGGFLMRCVRSDGRVFMRWVASSP